MKKVHPITYDHGAESQRHAPDPPIDKRYSAVSILFTCEQDHMWEMIFRQRDSGVHIFDSPTKDIP
jgi:hypothetical protein